MLLLILLGQVSSAAPSAFVTGIYCLCAALSRRTHTHPKAQAPRVLCSHIAPSFHGWFRYVYVCLRQDYSLLFVYSDHVLCCGLDFAYMRLCLRLTSTGTTGLLLQARASIMFSVLGAVFGTVVTLALLLDKTSAFVCSPIAKAPRIISFAPSSTATAARMSATTYAPQSVQAAWDNHLAAFGGRDVSAFCSTLISHHFFVGSVVIEVCRLALAAPYF